MGKLSFGRSNQSTPSNPVDGIANVVANYKMAIEQQKLKNIDKGLTDYFVNNGIGDSGLSTASGEITYDSTFEVPDYKTAWQNYQDIYSNNGKSVGMEHYGKFKQLYSEMTGNYANNLMADITRFTNAGYSERELRKAMSNNPNFAANYSTLISDPLKGKDYGAAFAPYGPKKSMYDDIMDSPGTMGIGTAVLGGAGLYGASKLSEVSDTEMTRAKVSGRNALDKARSTFNKEVATADKIPKDLKNSDAYKAADKAGKTRLTKAAKKSAQTLKDEAKAKFGKVRGERLVNPASRAKQLSTMANKLPGLAKGIGITAVPMMIEGAVTEMADDADTGAIAGKGVRAGLTVSQAISSGAQLKPALSIVAAKIKQHGLAKVLKRVIKKRGLKLAGATLAKVGAGTVGGALTGGVVTAAMAAWTIKDLYDISQILADM